MARGPGGCYGLRLRRRPKTPAMRSRSLAMQDQIAGSFSTGIGSLGLTPYFRCRARPQGQPPPVTANSSACRMRANRFPFLARVQIGQRSSQKSGSNLPESGSFMSAAPGCCWSVGGITRTPATRGRGADGDGSQAQAVENRRPSPRLSGSPARRSRWTIPRHHTRIILGCRVRNARPAEGRDSPRPRARSAMLLKYRPEVKYDGDCDSD